MWIFCYNLRLLANVFIRKECGRSPASARTFLSYTHLCRFTEYIFSVLLALTFGHVYRIASIKADLQMQVTFCEVLRPIRGRKHECQQKGSGKPLLSRCLQHDAACHRATAKDMINLRNASCYRQCVPPTACFLGLPKSPSDYCARRARVRIAILEHAHQGLRLSKWNQAGRRAARAE